MSFSCSICPHTVRLGLVFPLLLTFCSACTPTAPPEGPDLGGTAPLCDALPLDFTSRAVPIPPNDTTNVNCAWDLFAWNSFAALNWPADVNRRGFPDSTKTFLAPGGNGTELVWETFKEKREVFQPNPDTTWNVQEIKFPTPNNIWNQFGGFCTAEEEQMGNTPERGFIFQGKFHHDLDETVEVASEALEPDSVLCKGHDAGCFANGKAVGPRVWKGKPNADGSGARPVYYEVRVNYDFFDYVFNNQTNDTPFPLYDDHNAVTSAILGEIQLPVRAAYTRNNSGSNPNQNPGIGGAAYNPQACLDVYDDPTAQVPCKIGSIHTKSAWIQLEAGDDTTQYHTTEAIYYKEVDNQTNTLAEPQICMAIGKFGMIGLHIIQRVHIKNGGAIGGAFIFATWEHEEIIQEDGSSDYYYVNYEIDLQTDNNQLTPFPTPDNAIMVSRLLVEPQPAREEGCTLSQQQTCTANTLAHKELAGTVWENYQLVGTQFRPFADKTTSNAYAQPYYLANLVIETNQGLQQFQGLPPLQPRFQPPQWCATDANGNCLTDGTRLVPPDNMFGFNRTTPNIAFMGSAYNMGGCQGCHGVAQQNGYAFSFVLLDGQSGAVADTEAEENIPPTKFTNSVNLSVQNAGNQLALNFGPDSTLIATAVVDQPIQQWTLVPYYKDSSFEIFAGTYIIQNAQLGEKGILTAPDSLGQPFRVQHLLPSPGGIGPSAPLSQSWTLVPQGRANRRVFFLKNYNGFVLQAPAEAGNPVIAAKPDSAASKGWRLVVPG